MLSRLVPVLGVIALVATACGSPDIVVRSEEPEGPSWFSLVVDSTSDAGSGLSLATDADGNPHLAYVALEEEVEGEAPPPDPLAPTLPAVMHAHLVGEAWTRGPVAEEQDIDGASETAIAVDAEGVHHVAWTAGGQILYSSNAGGEFAEEPETVADIGAVGLSIAADGDGTPMIAFQTALDEAEGPASLIRLATAEGEGAWTLETVAEASEPEEPAGTAVIMTLDGPVVAFGSDGATLVGERRGARWFSEIVDEDGGVGVAGAADADGNPHLAYLTGTGDVRHAHSIDGGPWEISDVGSGATGSPASIAVDAEGIHHMAWQTEDGLAYASNAGGDFAEEELPDSTAEGVRPRVGAGAEGTVYLAFRDEADTEVQMAVRSEDAPLLAVPAPEETGDGRGPAPTGPPPCQPEGTELAVSAQNIQFDTDCLAAPAGEPFTIEFDNQDSTPPHNFAIYTDQSAAEAIFQGEIFPGPAAETYDLDPIEEEGNLFFRCDVHPDTMTGTFVVAAADGEAGG
ncbi:MAG: cupredoxin domain-containing protein [Actinomycetota bacterium]